MTDWLNIDVKYTHEVWKEEIKRSWNLGLYIEQMKKEHPKLKAKIRLLKKLHHGMVFWCWRNMPNIRDYTLEELDKKGWLNYWKPKNRYVKDKNSEDKGVQDK